MVALGITKILCLMIFKLFMFPGAEINFLLLSKPNLKHLKLKMMKFHLLELSLISTNFKLTEYHFILLCFKKNLLALLWVSFLKKFLFYQLTSILFIPSKYRFYLLKLFQCILASRMFYKCFIAKIIIILSDS